MSESNGPQRGEDGVYRGYWKPLDRRTAIVHVLHVKDAECHEYGETHGSERDFWDALNLLGVSDDEIRAAWEWA